MPVPDHEYLLQNLLSDLQRQADWSSIVEYLEIHGSETFQQKMKKSPATYAKNKRWLLNTERLSLAQVIVLQQLRGRDSMSQGELIRLLGGNPNRSGITKPEKKEIKALNQYWSNQIRNNIRPLMGDYFELLTFQWVGDNKPGGGEYKIQAADLLMQFFKDVLYQETPP